MEEPEWKRIQKKTFTRWCNEQLRVRGMAVDDLNNEFSDGLKLIALLEVLSHQKFKKYNKKPRIHAQKIENVTMALSFLREEKVKLVNIGKESQGLNWQMLDGNILLILAILWEPGTAI